MTNSITLREAEDIMDYAENNNLYVDIIDLIKKVLTNQKDMIEYSNGATNYVN